MIVVGVNDDGGVRKLQVMWMVSREKVQIQSGERDILMKKEERDFTKNDINFNFEIYSFVVFVSSFFCQNMVIT
jgi:hypothetical protein